MTMTLRAATLSLLLSIACNGELTTSVAPIDRIYIFYHFIPVDETSCCLEMEIYMQVDSFLKKPLVFLMGPMFKKSMVEALQRLDDYLEESKAGGE